MLHYKPSIAVCSLFRDSIDHVHRTFLERSTWSEDRLFHVCVEGDSTDGTFKALLQYQSEKVRVIKKNTNKPKWGSVIDSERFRVLAGLWNIAIEAARKFKPDYYFILDGDISVGHEFYLDCYLTVRLLLLL
jgi:cellulose synthase/poly-beta-1,6-N-acetylglucosamine synthase-like glycosyltransferase